MRSVVQFNRILMNACLKLSKMRKQRIRNKISSFYSKCRNYRINLHKFLGLNTHIISKIFWRYLLKLSKSVIKILNSSIMIFEGITYLPKVILISELFHKKYRMISSVLPTEVIPLHFPLLFWTLWIIGLRKFRKNLFSSPKVCYSKLLRKFKALLIYSFRLIIGYLCLIWS